MILDIENSLWMWDFGKISQQTIWNSNLFAWNLLFGGEFDIKFHYPNCLNLDDGRLDTAIGHRPNVWLDFLWICNSFGYIVPSFLDIWKNKQAIYDRDTKRVLQIGFLFFKKMRSNWQGCTWKGKSITNSNRS